MSSQKDDHNEIMRELGSIQSTLGSMDEHLAELNSKVAKNRNDIRELESENVLVEHQRQSYEDKQDRRSEYIDWAAKGLIAFIVFLIVVGIINSLQDIDLLTLL